MNLFENIFDKFTKQAQPQVPTSVPQAPRTASYVAPNIPIKTAPKISQGIRNGGFAPGYEGTVDETKGSFFQGLQGVQNVFNELPKALEATAQSGKRQFDEDIKKKQQSFVSEMLAEGYNEDAIFQALDQLKAKGEFDFKPGIAGSIVGGLGERIGNISQTTERLSQIDNPLERTVAGVIPYAGQTVATALQPITSAIEPYVSPVVQKIVQETNQTERLQDWSNQWSQFEKTNPILAENIAGLLNVSQLAPVPFVKPIANATGNVVKQTGKSIVRGAEKVAPKVVQGIKTGAKATGEGVGKVTKSIVSQQSGLGTPAIESILSKPELQGKIRSGELSGAKTLEEARSSIDALREGYRETGKMYDTVRKSNIPVAKNEAKQVLLSQLESEGLATGGKLNLVDLPVKDRGAITQALKYIDEYGDTMTPQNALSIRQKLDDLINYKSDVGSNGQRIVQGLRSKYDEFLGNKLPGLKEIDAKYAPERQFWESIRKDIYKADGTLKDNALSVVSNITNKGNEARLARMEQILPGIGEKVKALKAFDDIQNASGIKVGTYGRAATTGAIALASVPLAIASWVATHPVVVARVLESIGIASQKIKSILAKGKNITKEDATIIQNAVAKTPKSKVEGIINNLSYDPKTSKLTSKTLVKKPIVKPNSTKNAKQSRNIVKPSTKSDSDIPEGYFKNAFGEIQKNPSNKKGGFIKIPEIGKKIDKKEIQDLVVLHNLSLEKIKKINELGGLPGPSLAVTKKSIPFEDFGDITLVGDKDLIQSMKAKTYSADIYSPRVPQPDYVPKKNSIIKSELTKLDSEVKEYGSSGLTILEDLMQGEESNSVGLLAKFAKDNGIKINKVNKKAYYGGGFDGYEYVSRITPDKLSKYVTDVRNQNNDVFISDMQKVMDNIVKDNFPGEKSPKMYFGDSDRLYMYLKDSQKGDIYDSIGTARGIRDIIDEKGLRDKYNEFTQELKNTLADKMLYKGRNNYTGTKKYTAYNLDNVIKEMFSKGNQGAESSIFAGNLSQTMGKEAKSLTIPQIKKSSFGSSPELDAKYEKLKNEWSDIVGWDGARVIDTAFNSKGNPETILKKLHEYSDGEKFTLSDIKRLQEIATEATNLPKSYLETKFTRAVGLKEFQGVIAPIEQIPELKQLLKGTGLEDKIIGYKKGESRNMKLDEMQKKYGNIFFNIGGAYIGMKALENYLLGDDEN